MDDLRSRVAGEPVARLATLDRDGRPHLVPIVFALLGDTLYTAVDATPKRLRTLRRMATARERQTTGRGCCPGRSGCDAVTD